jgi:hypothetical protein
MELERTDAGSGGSFEAKRDEVLVRAAQELTPHLKALKPNASDEQIQEMSKKIIHERWRKARALYREEIDIQDTRARSAHRGIDLWEEKVLGEVNAGRLEKLWKLMREVFTAGQRDDTDFDIEAEPQSAVLSPQTVEELVGLVPKSYKYR